MGATQLDKHGTFVYVGYNRLLHCRLQLMLVTHGGLQLVYADNTPACQYTQLPIPLALVHEGKCATKFAQKSFLKSNGLFPS